MTKAAGLLFFIGGTLLWMGITSAEIFYPGAYSIRTDMISTLGASPPPDSKIFYPSANIFDFSLLLAGFAIISGGYILRKATHALSFLTILMGLGVTGVGLYPAFHVYLHPVMALIAFLVGALTAIASAHYQKPPFQYASVALGLVSLVFLILGLFDSQMMIDWLGKGGTERWVAYPTMIWLIAFGGYLMSGAKLSANSFFSKGRA